MKRVFAIAVLADFSLVLLLLHSHIKDFLWTHPWWHSFIVAIPGIAAPILAFMDMRDSAKANQLRADANVLRRQNASLTEELDTERNRHLQQIAQNVKPQLTQAEKTATKLKKYLRKKAFVSEGKNNWGAGGAEIVDVSEDNILTLFVPAGYSSSSAYAVYVRCDELEMIEAAGGGCDLQIRVLKRYGDAREMGQISNWDQKEAPPTQPRPRGNNAYHADYTKDGSSERRGIYIYAPTNGNPMYTLVMMQNGREVGAPMYDNNVEVSKKFAVIQVQHRAEGFRYGGGGTGFSPDPLYIFVH
jgi:hypothetical protein